jgi:predicted lipid-binding transport protein (Tim44 family)
MKKYFLRNLAIAASLSVAAVSCTPSSPSPNNTKSAATSSPTTAASPTVASTPSPSPTVASTPSPSPTATATATARPNATASPSAEKPADTIRIAVVNNSGKTLKSVFMSAPKKEEWGQNELTSPIKDREKADFEWKRSDYKGDDAGCIFDIRAEYDDGTFAELDPIDVCKTPAINLK